MPVPQMPMRWIRRREGCAPDRLMAPVAILPARRERADPGWREDGGEAVQELQGRESEGGTACGIGGRENVEDLVGAADD